LSGLAGTVKIVEIFLFYLTFTHLGQRKGKSNGKNNDLVGRVHGFVAQKVVYSSERTQCGKINN
jgi:hypothetical protein